MRKTMKSFDYVIKVVGLCATVRLIGCDPGLPESNSDFNAEKMTKKTFWIFLLCLYSLPVFSANLLFKSGFESDVTVLPMKTPYNAVYSIQNITGSDVTGYTSPMSINGSESSYLDNIINSPGGPVTDLNDYFDTHIETVTGHTGASTQALYQSLTQEVPDTITQSWWYINFGSPAPIEADGDLYVKYWMKFPSDLGANMGMGNFRSVFFWKSEDTDYRIEASVQTPADSTALKWVIVQDGFVSGVQQVHDKGYPVQAVPVGEWFLMEWFYHRSHDNTGRFWWAVNGEVLYDKYMANYGPNDSHINRLGLFGLYEGTPTAYPSYQWIDDVEVWDGFPCGDGVSCFNKEPKPPTINK